MLTYCHALIIGFNCCRFACVINTNFNYFFNRMSIEQTLAPKGDEPEKIVSPNIGESNSDESNDIPINEVDDGTDNSTRTTTQES